MIDQRIIVDDVEYEISDRGDLYMVTIASSFTGYISKVTKEYLGKNLPAGVVNGILEGLY